MDYFRLLKIQSGKKLQEVIIKEPNQMSSTGPYFYMIPHELSEARDGTNLIKIVLLSVWRLHTGV